MEIIRTGRIISCYYNYINIGFGSLLHKQQSNADLIQIRTYAKRKGYREAAKKKKVKVVIEKQPWIPHNLRNKDDADTKASLRIMEDKKIQAVDDVWISKIYSWRLYGLKEAVEAHRQTHHPTMYNNPDTQVNLFIELDMRTAKPTRFVEKFRRMAILPHIFEQDGLQERSILAFCKTPEQKEEAQNAGANLVGGVDIIKQIEKGKIVLPDFRYIIAHPSILAEIVTIRGLLKRRFPNVQSGTLGTDIAEMISQFKNGVEYTAFRDEKQRHYGWIDTTIGRLNMDSTKLEENFKALVDDINKLKPVRPGPFITRVFMTSPPFPEMLKVNIEPYLEDEPIVEGESSDEDEAVPAKL